MKNKLALVVAVILSLFAMLAVYSIMEQSKKKGAGGVPVEVALSTKLITPNTLLTRKDFIWEKLPKNTYDRMSDALISRDEINNYLDTQKVRKEVDEGQFLLRSHFTSAYSGAGETSLVAKLGKPGNRAMSISVDFIQGISGLLKPGSHVDIVVAFAFQIKGFGAYQVTTTLLSDRTILALDSFSQVTLGEGPTKKLTEYTSVTLLVTKQEAVLLTHCLNFSKGLHLLLKKKMDNLDTPTKYVDNYTLAEQKHLRIETHPLIKRILDGTWE